MGGDINARVKAALAALSLPQTALAAAAETTSGYISAICAGKKKPSVEVLAALIGLGIDANWLMIGEGGLRRGTPAASPPPTPPPPARAATPSGLEVDLGPDLAAELRRLCRVDSDGRLRLRVLAYVQGVADAAPAPRTLAAG